MPSPDFNLGDPTIAEEREPLFSDDDPLTFTLIDAENKKHLFHCEDYPSLPDDKRGGLSDRPKSYMVESVVVQVIADEQDRCRDLIEELLDDRIINERDIIELLKQLNAERNKAERKAMKRKTRGRPTSAPSDSLS